MRRPTLYMIHDTWRKNRSLRRLRISRSALNCVFAMLIMQMSVSCRHREASQLEIEADQLYHKSVEITKLYTDSLQKAKDSTTVARLNHGLEDRITKLNYNYKPEVYLEISQGQNDTLTNLTLRFAMMRDSLLTQLSNRLRPPTILLTPTPTPTQPLH